MKHKLTLAVLALLLTIGISSAAAHADTVSFTLTNSSESISGQTGGTLVYEVTASAPLSNGAAVNLNGDSFNVGSPSTLDDSDFFADAPFFLSPGDSDTFDLFTVSVSAGTTPGNYSGFFTALGGATGLSSDVLGTVEFTTVVTPEPSNFLLLATGLAGTLTTFRRKPFGTISGERSVLLFRCHMKVQSDHPTFITVQPNRMTARLAKNSSAPKWPDLRRSGLYTGVSSNSLYAAAFEV
jgi:hypothetical protein